MEIFERMHRMRLFPVNTPYMLLLFFHSVYTRSHALFVKSSLGPGMGDTVPSLYTVHRKHHRHTVNMCSIVVAQPQKYSQWIILLSIDAVLSLRDAFYILQGISKELYKLKKPRSPSFQLYGSRPKCFEPVNLWTIPIFFCLQFPVDPFCQTSFNTF